MDRAKHRLVRALEQAEAPEQMIAEARAGRYDDFESESASPITDLVADLLEVGQKDLAQRAMRGEFDATKEEAEEWFRKAGLE